MFTKNGPELACSFIDHVLSFGFVKVTMFVLQWGVVDTDKSESFILLKLVDILKSDNLGNVQGMEMTCKVNVDNVECSYFDQVDKLQGFGSRSGESIAQLVWAFFNYWAYRHDYANDVSDATTL